MNPFSVITSKIYAGLAIFFLSIVLAQTVRIEGFLFIDGYKETLAKRDKTIADIAAAQEAATTDQIDANHAPAAKSKTIAEKSNADTDYYAKGRAAGLAYAVAHPVQRHDECSPRAADLPRTNSPVPSDDGPREAADYVAVSRSDFEILTGNSLRLAKVQQDAQSLIDAGVAIPTPDF